MEKALDLNAENPGAATVDAHEPGPFTSALRTIGNFPSSRVLRLLSLFALSIFPLACGVSFHGIDAVTQVARAPGENVARDCFYELILAKPADVGSAPLRQSGVFVVYERGDSSVIFGDPAIRQLLQTMHFSLVLANECDAATYSDFQSNPYMGPGRQLFQALSQFAALTGHAELASAKVLLYGFSAGGVLAAEMATYAPTRILGVIAYAAGSAHQNFSAFTPSPAALAVPTLFMANALDAEAGTTRNLNYFTAGKTRGANWAYAVQNGVGHCCNASTQPMVLAWVPAVVALIGAAQTPLPLASSRGVDGAFICSPDGTTDAQKDEDCSFSFAAIDPTLAPPSGTPVQTVWLPGVDAAQAWLEWVAPLT